MAAVLSSLIIPFTGVELAPLSDSNANVWLNGVFINAQTSYTAE